MFELSNFHFRIDNVFLLKIYNFKPCSLAGHNLNKVVLEEPYGVFGDKYR